MVAIVSSQLSFSQEGLKTPSDSIRYYIKLFKVENPEIAFYMFAQESGYGTSNLAVKHNNYFGSKMPRGRTTTATSETKGGWAKYPSMRASVLDFRIYELLYLRGKSKPQILKYLREVYSKDENYLYKFLGY